MEIRFNNRLLITFTFLFIVIFSLITLKFIAFKVILGFILLFILPFYLILDNFDLDMEEKIIFSFFIGVIFFSSLVYLIGNLFGVRFSIILTFIILIFSNLFLKKFIFKNKNKSNKDIE